MFHYSDVLIDQRRMLKKKEIREKFRQQKITILNVYNVFSQNVSHIV